MRKTILTLGASCLALSGVMATPAHATIVPTLQHSAAGVPTGAANACQDAIHPPSTDDEEIDDPADATTPWLFRVYVISSTPGSPVATGLTQIDPNSYHGAGDPVPVGGDASNITDWHALYTHGGSPNLFGKGKSLSSTYPYSTYTYYKQYQVTDHYTLGCEVYKQLQHGKKAGQYVEPAGLQIPRETPSHADALTYDDVHAPYFDLDHGLTGTDGPPVPNGPALSDVDMVVCISPNTTGKKPGDWRVQNNAGITKDGCAAAATYWRANGWVVPSLNAP
jgi:hypothetical protein